MEKMKRHSNVSREAAIEYLVYASSPSLKAPVDLALIDDVEAYLRDLGVASIRMPNDAGDKATLFATIGPSDRGGTASPYGCRAGRRPGAGAAIRCCASRRARHSARTVSTKAVPRRCAGPRPPLPEERASDAHPSRLLLRRGNDLPRRHRSHIPHGCRFAATARGDRRRADLDAARGRAQERGDLQHACASISGRIPPSRSSARAPSRGR